MKRISIKLRITLWYSFFMCLIVVVVIGILLGVSKGVTISETKDLLMKVVDDNIDEIDYDDGILEIDEDIELFQDGVYLQIYSQDLKLIDGRIPSSFNVQLDFKNREIQKINTQGNTYYVYDELIAFDKGKDIWIRGVVSLEAAITSITIMIYLAFLILPFLVILSIAIGYSIAKRSFKPIEKINSAANAISEGKDLSKRIGLEEGGDEIHQLATTFDRMFERLEDSFEAEKQFTSDASHELRTPISVILASCEYGLAQEVDINERIEALETIQRQAYKMRNLVTQLLAFTRLDRGIEKLHLEEIDLSELIEITCEENKARNEKGITLDWKVEPNLKVEADFSLMARLINNLINNAYQYGKENGWIYVSLGKKDNIIELIVKDNGIGIAKEEQSKIWKRFYQVDQSRTRNESENMGLGLAMVLWITKVHGGKIKVESGLGKGSSFIFMMPIKNE